MNNTMTNNMNDNRMLDISTFFPSVIENVYFYNEDTPSVLYKKHKDGYSAMFTRHIPSPSGINHMLYDVDTSAKRQGEIGVHMLFETINGYTKRFIDMSLISKQVKGHTFFVDSHTHLVFFLSQGQNNYPKAVYMTPYNGFFHCKSKFNIAETIYVSEKDVNEYCNTRHEKPQTLTNFIKKEEAKMNTKGYIIGNVMIDGNIGFSSKPKIHTTEVSAKHEIERLAATNKGVKFVLCEIKNFVICDKITWS